ncbi:MAG: hypothetical protein HQ581_06250 [Planctomycetes bacterium]|nr:hypothetical protein [Planctomycetota bacterium]
MADSPMDIDRIVYEVLARLGAAPRARSAPNETAASSTSGDAAAPESQGRLILAARVVTMKDIAGRLGGVQRLVVLPEAVVTPSVCDELRDRDVTLVRETCQGGNHVPAARLVLTVVGSKFDPAPLVDVLRKKPGEIESQRIDCSLGATDRAAEAVGSGNALAIVLCKFPAAVACLANRQQGVRAVAATDTSGTAAALASVGANVLVADPTKYGLVELRRIIEDFRDAGIRACPPVFRDRLG